MTLTDEEIKIKVHKALGWTERMQGPTHYAWSRGDYWHYLHEVPNYPEDLNACAEFEATLTPVEFEKYRWILWDAVKQPQMTEWNRAYLSATARQRCLAYLKVKGIIP